MRESITGARGIAGVLASSDTSIMAVSRRFVMGSCLVLAVAFSAAARHLVSSRTPEERVRALLAAGAGLDAARLVVDEGLAVEDIGLLARLAQGLPRGDEASAGLAIRCLEKALELCGRPGYRPPVLGELDPERRNFPTRQDFAIRARLAVLYWEAGRKDETRAQVRAVLDSDPGNLLMAALVQRFDKQSLKVAPVANALRRRVRFTSSAPGERAPYLAGSWNASGVYDQLGGWAREPMQRELMADGRARWVLTRELTFDPSRWFAAVALDRAEKPGRARAFARFPVFGSNQDTLAVDLDEFPLEAPHEMFAPRNRAPPAKRAARPRLVLFCIDSATWNVVMPLIQAGSMPRLASLLPGAAVGIIDAPAPISGIVFSELNFGKAEVSTPQAVWLNALEVLKERGFEAGPGISIAGRPNTWQALARAGISTLYVSWGEQVSYAPGGQETVHAVAMDPKVATIGGRALARDEDIVRAFLPESERRAFDGLKTSDSMVMEVYRMGAKKFPEGFRLLREVGAQVSLLHVGFVDYSYHNGWWAMDPPERWLSMGARPVRRYAHVIENAHRLADVMIGELADGLDLSYDSLVVWSDHGAAGGLLARDMGHARDGLIVAAGPLFKPGVLTGVFPVSGLAPTVFAALGQPVPEGYGGKPVHAALKLTPAAPVR